MTEKRDLISNYQIPYENFHENCQIQIFSNEVKTNIQHIWDSKWILETNHTYDTLLLKVTSKENYHSAFS